MKFFKKFLKFSLFVFLTITTQIGGVVFLSTLLFHKKSTGAKTLIFIGMYMFSTFIVVPRVAPIFGRERIKTNDYVKVHTYLTVLANRNYVKPEMNEVLDTISKTINVNFPNLQIHCLDANFPFFDGFPLLPHLSHKDGKKLDISLIYESSHGQIVNKKPSISGYGVFAGPNDDEYDQIKSCKEKGYWQYDYPKYVTLGVVNKDLIFSKRATKELVQLIANEDQVAKVFIEPHLKTRMNLKNTKIRYHGCRAVRHDDHIHFQIK